MNTSAGNSGLTNETAHMTSELKPSLKGAFTTNAPKDEKHLCSQERRLYSGGFGTPGSSEGKVGRTTRRATGLV